MKRLVALTTVLVFGTALAAADWSDNFDLYATGSQMHGQGGWHGWDGSAAAGAVTVGTPHRSAPNAVDINGATDLVHEYSGYSSGEWFYTAWQYIPSSATGTTYFILLNTYNDLGPYDWSVEVAFDLGTNTIIDDFVSGVSLPIVRDTWVPLRVEIDLTADSRSIYYNDQLLSTSTWTTGTASVLNIAAVDLYANSASPVYYDDISLVPEPAACLLLVLATSLLRRR
jgi:hypothetical protein